MKPAYNWHAMLPWHIAMPQEAWDRRHTALRCYAVSGETFNQVARRFGVGRARAWQMVQRAKWERAAGKKPPAAPYLDEAHCMGEVQALADKLKRYIRKQNPTTN